MKLKDFLECFNEMDRELEVLVYNHEQGYSEADVYKRKIDTEVRKDLDIFDKKDKYCILIN